MLGGLQKRLRSFCKGYKGRIVFRNLTLSTRRFNVPYRTQFRGFSCQISYQLWINLVNFGIEICQGGHRRSQKGKWRPESFGTVIGGYCGCHSDEDELPILSAGPNALVVYGMFCRCLRGLRFSEDIRWDMSGTSLKCCLWDLLKPGDTLP